jgi:hypothetical protein
VAVKILGSAIQQRGSHTGEDKKRLHRLRTELSADHPPLALLVTGTDRRCEAFLNDRPVPGEFNSAGATKRSQISIDACFECDLDHIQSPGSLIRYCHIGRAMDSLTPRIHWWRRALIACALRSVPPLCTAHCYPRAETIRPMCLRLDVRVFMGPGMLYSL